MKTITLEDDRDYLTYREGSGGTVEIFDLCVGTERGVGRGRQLVELLLAEVRGRTHLVYAITRKSNEIARQFYRAVGFERIGYLDGFYWDTREAAIMFGMKI